jgi:outer membrane lipoprotein SlyB
MRVLTSMCAVGVLALGLTACASSPYDTAQTRCERNRQSDQVAGAAVGAAVGALAGSAIAGNSSNTEGTIAGGVLGGVIGSQVAKGQPCPPGYSYYPPPPPYRY